MSLKAATTFLALALAYASGAASAADVCPYSLVRFQGERGERIGLIANADMRAKEARVTLAQDITDLIVNRGKQTPAEAIRDAFLAPAMQAEIGGWACEAKNLEAFRELHPEASLVALTPEKVLAPSMESGLISGRELASALEGRLPAGLGLVVRAPIAAGTEIAPQNIADHVAGAFVGKRFIPLEFLDGAGNELFLIDASLALSRAARRLCFSPGDIVRITSN